jgi:hypothetical protein
LSVAFVSERGSPFSPASFAKMVERAGKKAAFKAQPRVRVQARERQQADPIAASPWGTTTFNAPLPNFKDFWR